MVKYDVITVGGREYEIKYAHPGEWLKEYPSSVAQLVQVSHNVKGNKNENLVKKEFAQDQDEILKKIREYLKVNSEEFKQIKINYSLSGPGFSIGRAGGQELVISLFSRLDTSFK